MTRLQSIAGKGRYMNRSPVCWATVFSLLIAATALGQTAPPPSAPLEKPRTWTDSTGKYKVEATFLEFKDGRVRFRKADGTESSIALERLSAPDQQYVKGLAKAELPPKAEPVIDGQAGRPKPPTKKAPPLAVAPLEAAQAKAHQESWANHVGTTVEISNSIDMKLVLIPPGEFQMGTREHLIDGLLNRYEGPQHRVRITKPFYLAAHEVTQQEYVKVMGANPSTFQTVAGLDTARLPVETVSWDDAMAFCDKLSRQEGQRYRLPTEAEWEYACRAGTTTRFHVGDLLDSTQANCNGQRPIGKSQPGPWLERPHTVGSYAPNAWGLFDMHGNVWEWCSSWADEDVEIDAEKLLYQSKYYAASPVDDPPGPTEIEALEVGAEKFRRLRGGSWHEKPVMVRSAMRYAKPQTTFRFKDSGFRVVRDLATGDQDREHTKNLSQPSVLLPQSTNPNAAPSKPRQPPKRPEPLSPEVIAAWKEAGAEVGYQGNQNAFRFASFPAGKLRTLPQPAVSFELFLEGATVTDAALDEVAQLQHLPRLRLSNAPHVTEAGLKELAGLNELRALTLFGVPVTDAGLKELSALKQLEELRFTGGNFTDAGLKELTGLQELRVLDLDADNVSDAGLKHLAGLTQLQHLSLVQTGVSDAGLKELASMKELETLILFNTRVTDAGMKDLARMQLLRSLDLSQTQVTDRGLQDLAGLKNLRDLTLFNHRFVTKAGVDELQKSLPECRMHTKWNPSGAKKSNGP